MKEVYEHQKSAGNVGYELDPEKRTSSRGSKNSDYLGVTHLGPGKSTYHDRTDWTASSFVLTGQAGVPE